MSEDAHVQKIDANPWLQMLLSGLLTGGIAWGGMSIRMNNVENRAQEDRLAFSRSIEQLTTEINLLRWELQREREARLTERSGRTLEQPPPSATFPRGKTFDK